MISRYNEERLTFKRSGQLPIAATTSAVGEKGKHVLLTPSLKLGYNDVFNAEVGLQYMLDFENKSTGIRRRTRYSSPVGAVALDLLKLIDPSNSSGLLLSVSHARSKTDMISIVRPFYTIGGGGTTVVFRNDTIPSSAHTVTDAGFTLSVLKNRLRLTYNFEQNNYERDAYKMVYTPFIYVATADVRIKLSSHRFGIQYSTDPEKMRKYSTTLAVYKMQPDLAYTTMYQFLPNEFDDLYPRRGWSGGWINSFACNRFVAGIKFLYLFPPKMYEANSLALQHLYAGYEFKKAEWYLSARNLFRNRKSVLVNGDLAYYGIGFKMKMK